VQGDFQEEVFQRFLDRIRIVIHAVSGDIIRDVRREPFSEGVKYYGKGVLPWWSARVSCSDYDDAMYLGCKHEIDFAFYYDPTDSDKAFAESASVMAVEFGFQGAYAKDLVVDGKVVFKYVGHGQVKTSGAFWYNLETGEIFGL
jgi:hypothetical protein